jgi:antitoxin YefM
LKQEVNVNLCQGLYKFYVADTVDNHKQAVLVSVNEWNSIQETLYLMSIPGVKDDLIEGKNTDWKDCTPLEEVEW